MKVKRFPQQVFHDSYGSVTIRCPARDPFEWIAVFYGFVPWLVPIGCAICFIATWLFVELTFLPLGPASLVADQPAG